jgi:hypothetical protein
MAAAQVISAFLLSYMHLLKELEKPPDLNDAFKIPADDVDAVMREPFTGDGSMAPSDHLYSIEARYSLFKLSGISQDEAKKKLLYVSLKGEARNWYHSLKHTDRLN